MVISWEETAARPQIGLHIETKIDAIIDTKIDAEKVSKNDSKIIRKRSQNDREIDDAFHFFAKGWFFETKKRKKKGLLLQ